MTKVTSSNEQGSIQARLILALLVAGVGLGYIFLAPASSEQRMIGLVSMTAIIVAAYFVFVMPMRLSQILLPSSSDIIPVRRTKAITHHPQAIQFLENLATNMQHKTGNQTKVVLGMVSHIIEVHVLDQNNQVLRRVEFTHINPRKMWQSIEPMFAIKVLQEEQQ